MDELAGRVAIVTGAGSGIGRAAAILFHRHGATVCLAGRSEEGLLSTRSLLERDGDALVHVVDVADEREVDAMVSACERELGVPDVVFSNAGMTLVKPALELAVEEWDRVMAVNARGGFLLAKRVIPGMRTRGAGAIVFCGSIDGMFGDYEVSAYTASKGAVTQLARALALEHAKDNIRVNTVAPGITQTPMQMGAIGLSDDPAAELEIRKNLAPLGRMIEPMEVAEAALFLASDRSSGITGQTLVVDGGATTAWMNPPASYLPA